MLAERRIQQIDISTKKKGSFSQLFGRSKENPDLRKELEAKSKSKSIDITAFERRKDAESAKPEQHDFRHLLRHTDPSNQPPMQSEGVWPRPETHQTSRTSSYQPKIERLRDEDESTNSNQDYDHETLF